MARIKLKKDKEECDPRALQMAEIVMNMRNVYTHMPVETGLICYRQAYEVNPFAETAQDVGRLVANTEERAWRKFKKMENISKYAMWAIIALVTLVLAIYVLSGVLLK